MGCVFAYAGYAKLIEPIENFRGNLTHYGVIPYALVPAIALILPWLELIFGSFLILGYAPKLSASVLGVFSLIFIGVIISSWVVAGSDMATCGCFGQGGLQLTPQQIFVLDLIDLALAVGLIRQKQFPWSLDALLRR